MGISNDIVHQHIISELPTHNFIKRRIGDIIGFHNNDIINEHYIVPMDKIAKCKGYKFNVVTVNDYDSQCFTKSYATKKKYSKGTGSFFASKLVQIEDIMQFERKYDGLFKNKKVIDHEKVVQLLSSVGLRYFSPKEMSLLMGFPSDLLFVDDMKDSQFYKLIGNSINVQVVTHLLTVNNLIYTEIENEKQTKSTPNITNDSHIYVVENFVRSTRTLVARKAIDLILLFLGNIPIHHQIQSKNNSDLKDFS